MLSEEASNDQDKALGNNPDACKQREVSQMMANVHISLEKVGNMCKVFGAWAYTADQVCGSNFHLHTEATVIS